MTTMIIPEMNHPIDPDDIPIENYRNLAAAVVHAAGEDYREACEDLVGFFAMITGGRNITAKRYDKLGRCLGTFYQCQQFFKSDRYQIMCEVDGDWVNEVVMENTGLTKYMVDELDKWIGEHPRPKERIKKEEE